MSRGGNQLAHSYRTLQQWNHWLTQHFLGERLLQAEQQSLTSILNQQFGKHAILIGVPHQQPLLDATRLPCHTLLSPLVYHDTHSNYIESDLHELPLLTGSVDLLILPHTLEYIDNHANIVKHAG